MISATHCTNSPNSPSLNYNNFTAIPSGLLSNLTELEWFEIYGNKVWGHEPVSFKFFPPSPSAL